MALNTIAFLWGYAEATLFFIVPDVLLSAIALFDLRRAVVASLAALAGALLGGASMYFFGEANPQEALEWLDAVPAVSHAMLQRVRAELSEQGVVAVLYGPLSGTPYKVYAAQAAAAGIGLGPFLLVSIAARWLRFLFSIMVAGGLARTVLRETSGKRRLSLLLALWGLFYGAYFVVMDA